MVLHRPHIVNSAKSTSRQAVSRGFPPPNSNGVPSFLLGNLAFVLENQLWNDISPILGYVNLLKVNAM